MRGAEDQHPELELAQPLQARAKWDLVERLADLEKQLVEQAERDQIKELEIGSLRHELQLRLSYNSHLERLAMEQRERIDYLQGQLGHLTDTFAAESAAARAALDAERARTDAERARADAETSARRAAEDLLKAERARISYRLTQRLLSPLSRRREHR
jgi:hypothetical protein